MHRGDCEWLQKCEEGLKWYPFREDSKNGWKNNVKPSFIEEEVTHRVKGGNITLMNHTLGASQT